MVIIHTPHSKLLQWSYMVCGFGINHWWARYKTNDHVNVRADGKFGICTDHSHVSLNSLPHMHTPSFSHPAASCAFDYCRKKMQTYLFTPVAWLGSSHISRMHSLNIMIEKLLFLWSIHSCIIQELDRYSTLLQNYTQEYVTFHTDASQNWTHLLR